MTCLYRAFDAEGTLLYVGISGSVVRRLAEHSKDKEWWSEVTDVKVEHFATRADAIAAEAVAISCESPRHNVASAGNPWIGADPLQSAMRAAGVCGVSELQFATGLSFRTLDDMFRGTRSTHLNSFFKLGDGLGIEPLEARDLVVAVQDERRATA